MKILTASAITLVLTMLLSCSLKYSGSENNNLERLYKEAYDMQNRFIPVLLSQDPNEGETWLSVVSSKTVAFQLAFKESSLNRSHKTAKRMMASLVAKYGAIVLYPFNEAEVYYIDKSGNRASVRGPFLDAYKPTVFLAYIGIIKKQGKKLPL